MSKQPFFSIVIPVYNIEEYIAECLDSLIAQEFTDWEAIVVDDGSTDRSGKICDGYAADDGRIKVIHQENAGVAMARNTGVDASTGEWVAVLDGDDFYATADYLARIEGDVAFERRGCLYVAAGLARKYPDVEFISLSELLFKDSDPNELTWCGYGNERLIILPTELEQTPAASDALRPAVFQSLLQSLFIKKSFIRDTGLRYDCFHQSAEDMLYAAQCWLRAGSFVVSPAPAHCYRSQRAGSLMSSRRGKALVTAETYYYKTIANEMEESYKRTGNSNYLLIKNIHVRRIFLQQAYYRGFSEEGRAEIRRIVKECRKDRELMSGVGRTTIIIAALSAALPSSLAFLFMRALLGARSRSKASNGDTFKYSMSG
jgi:glycosyltransferase involved in cell wall biosynthesis